MKILIRGAGDLATGIAAELWERGHQILMTDVAIPLTVRREVAFSRAVYEEHAVVEGMEAVLAENFEEAETIMATRKIAVMVDEKAEVRKEYLPLQLEYSAKDDKFRLKAVCERHLHYVNVGRIKSCKMLEQTGEEACMLLEPERCAVTVLLTDERNALERAMLHFSHLEKITERLDEKHYRLQLMYNKSDETEMVIRILSFGPLLRVQEAAGFIELLRHRLRKQLALRAKE